VRFALRQRLSGHAGHIQPRLVRQHDEYPDIYIAMGQTAETWPGARDQPRGADRYA